MAGYTPLTGIKLVFPRIEIISISTLEILRWSISVAIILEFSGILPVVHFLESAGGSLCHHEAARCFAGTDGLWAVCARCSGLYFGWMIPMAIGSFHSTKIANFASLRLFAVLFLCAVAAALLERFGFVVTGNITRAILGVPLGIFPAVMFIFAIKRLKEISPDTPKT